MIKKSLIISAIFTAILIPASVYAQESASTLESRLNAALINQGVNLDEATRQKVISKCQNTQSQLIISRQSTDVAIQKRLVSYTEIQKELQAIELRMLRQGVDSSEIDLLIGKIQQSLDSFTMEADNYGVGLSDLILVDCKSKPEQFYAGLVNLRQQRAKLENSARQLKTVVEDSKNSTILPLQKRLTN